MMRLLSLLCNPITLPFRVVSFFLQHAFFAVIVFLFLSFCALSQQPTLFLTGKIKGELYHKDPCEKPCVATLVSARSGKSININSWYLETNEDSRFDGSTFGIEKAHGRLFPNIPDPREAACIFHFLANETIVEFGLDIFWDKQRKELVNIISTSCQLDTSYGNVVSINSILRSDSNFILLGTIHSHPYQNDRDSCQPSGFYTNGMLRKGGDRLFYHEVRRVFGTQRTPEKFMVFDINSQSIYTYHYTRFWKKEMTSIEEFESYIVKQLTRELSRMMKFDLQKAAKILSKKSH